MDVKQSIKRATDLYRSRQYEKAEEMLLQLVEQAPRYASLHNMLGVIYSYRNQFKKAIGHFQRALDINPDYTEAQLNLAITLADTGSYDQAMSEFEKASEREVPKENEISFCVRVKLAKAHIELGESYQELSLYEEAAEEYRKAIKLCPDFPDVFNRLGITYRERGLLEEAEEAFQQAIKLNPRYADPVTNLGVVYCKRGDLPQAIQRWQEALQINPKHHVAQIYLKLAASGGIAEGLLQEG